MIQEPKIIRIVKIDPTEERLQELRLSWALYWALNIHIDEDERTPRQAMADEVNEHSKQVLELRIQNRNSI